MSSICINLQETGVDACRRHIFCNYKMTTDDTYIHFQARYHVL